MELNRKKKIGIIIGITLIVAILALLAYSPVFRTGTLKIKYISDEANTGNNNDGINRSGNIMIFINEILQGTYKADQYITFSWVRPGEYALSISNGLVGYQLEGRMLASRDVTVNVLETTVVDLHYKDGFF